MKKPTGSNRIVADKRQFPDPKQPKKPQKPKKQPRRSRRRAGSAVTGGIVGLITLIWRVIWGSVWRLVLTAFLILFAASAYYYTTLPEATALFDGRARGSVTMLDSDGRPFAWRGETYGMVGADKIAPVLKEAVVATEDKRFYEHLGVDPRGIASAIRINLSQGRGALQGNGGSTITQQVSKLLCLGESFDPIKWKSESEYEAECRKSSLWRKLKEIPYSFAMEAKYSKDDILNIYMNRSYLGAGARGFEAASQRYFDKHASDVSASEAAMLAGLLKAPSYFAPTSDLQRAQDRASVILDLMHEQGYLDDAAYKDAKAHPAVLSKAAAARAGGYFADWVMDAGPGFLTSETTEDVTIQTTFDQRVQRAAERAVNRVFKGKLSDNSKVQVAVVVMSADGAVRAMIGGREGGVAGVFNRATQAKRQTGSSFKPFVYAAALDQGYTPNDLVLDGPLTIPIKGSAPWSPQNYTRKYHGEVTLATALAQSLNTATIRLQEIAGRDAVRRVAEDFGFANDLANGPALGLGVSESTLLEMTGAYAGIRNGGSAVKPYGLIELRIKGDEQPLIGQAGGIGKRVISQNSAAELIDMMKGVIQKGTGGRAKLPGREAAGKTGTTSSYRDAWFIGFTEQYVTGVWMGYDDNTPLKGVTGGGLPAEIWQAVMAEIHDGLPAEPLGGWAPDNDRAVPQVVNAGGGEASDPLAAALSEALGQPNPSPGAVVPQSSDTSGATVGMLPQDMPQDGTALHTPSSSVSSSSLSGDGGAGNTTSTFDPNAGFGEPGNGADLELSPNLPNSGNIGDDPLQAPPGDDDALTRALKGIDGVF
ncbi:transglycosylase domain-containing protein [Paracoccus aminophilus]|uniref:peptidoglycan glycosyltransferase n=1 Tax=Paracoccus aminophilus JCM 7686 TaxID=1367847 RepID=S5Y8G8_PARAH|nr:transglycosylase domain-containing protein [Paracoccus aminophilus]AGT07618.1 penicillin-binding protein, 1A family [Paracoccus aminophilus JCM 7686]